ncbi:hypothetical protein FEM48_Zijuj01G0247700 [Ziziphus jujuba var. spinosa]|uniref:DUF4283 domain-containing protein n=1 Tax=Ziziphus jujuba var. spinosa TaxID=714518 RepID=A0A978W4J5_ZIZJJ|nr:hypothetical protein FEM48_Zijuj01G0247700 [Ziziphus jujuba var. spinosa]
MLNLSENRLVGPIPRVDLRAALLKKCAAQSEQMEEDHLDDDVIMWRNLRFKLWIFQMIQQFPLCSCRSRNANSYENHGFDLCLSRDMKTMEIDSRWRIQGALEVTDLGNGYYLVKLPTWEDRSRVLSEGLWVIVGHYLSVQSWKPEFNPLTGRIHHMALWLGRTLKIDRNTEMANRGRFARICVELDISKPLVRKLIVGSRIQHVEYEGVGTIFFHYHRNKNFAGREGEYVPWFMVPNRKRRTKGLEKVQPALEEALDLPLSKAIF